MQNIDTTSKERRDAIRKAYADYLAVVADIESLDVANRIYKRIVGRPLTDKWNDVLTELLRKSETLQSSIINHVKEYFMEYSDLETLERYLNGLSGPSAYICALEDLTGENFV